METYDLKNTAGSQSKFSKVTDMQSWGHSPQKVMRRKGSMKSEEKRERANGKRLKKGKSKSHYQAKRYRNARTDIGRDTDMATLGDLMGDMKSDNTHIQMKTSATPSGNQLNGILKSVDPVKVQNDLNNENTNFLKLAVLDTMGRARSMEYGQEAVSKREKGIVRRSPSGKGNMGPTGCQWMLEDRQKKERRKAKRANSLRGQKRKTKRVSQTRINGQDPMK